MALVSNILTQVFITLIAVAAVSYTHLAYLAWCLWAHRRPHWLAWAQLGLCAANICLLYTSLGGLLHDGEVGRGVGVENAVKAQAAQRGDHFALHVGADGLSLIHI